MLRWTVRSSVPVFRMSHLFPGSVPGMSRVMTDNCLACMNVAILYLFFVLANGRFNKYIEHWVCYPFLGGNHLYFY